MRPKVAVLPQVARDLGLLLGHFWLRLRIGSDLSFFIVVFCIYLNGHTEGKARLHESTRDETEKRMSA
jgi:hypothetical protein